MLEGVPPPPSQKKDEDWEALELPERVALFKLKDHLSVLLPKLREDIEVGRIGAVIGIDSSGRLPALAMADAIKLLQEKRGFRGLARKFLRGKISFDNTALARLPAAIQKMHLPKDKKVLVIDDTYFHGGSARPIMKELKAQGYESQLIVLQSLQPDEMLREYPTALYATDVGNAMTFKQPSIMGVHKWEHTADIHAVPLRKEPIYVSLYGQLKKVGAARRVMKSLVESTVRDFDQEK